MYTCNVMPFGPVNNPATFITFTHAIGSVWTDLACLQGLAINDNTNFTITVDDIFLGHKQCQTHSPCSNANFACAKRITYLLNTGKRFSFPKRVEFGGIDVCPNGNRQALSKFNLLHLWPDPVMVHDVTKLVGFSQFYSAFIPNFELLLSPLSEIMKLE